MYSTNSFPLFLFSSIAALYCPVYVPLCMFLNCLVDFFGDHCMCPEVNWWLPLHFYHHPGMCFQSISSKRLVGCNSYIWLDIMGSGTNCYSLKLTATPLRLVMVAFVFLWVIWHNSVVNLWYVLAAVSFTSYIEIVALILWEPLKPIDEKSICICFGAPVTSIVVIWCSNWVWEANTSWAFKSVLATATKEAISEHRGMTHCYYWSGFMTLSPALLRAVRCGS
jgi:hypothetical protein